MKFVIQRVNSASVKVDGNVIGSIGKGYLILFGAGEGDTEDMLVPFADLHYMQIAGKATDQALYTPVSRILPMSYTRNS